MNDDDLMPWGKHRGEKLGQLPASYLLWLFEQPWIKDWPDLYAYLKTREEQLMKEKAANEPKYKAEGFDSYQDYKDYRGC